MARFISDILEAREPHFSQQIAELEKIAGKPGIDVRLVSELIQRRKNILKSLELDDSDTKTTEIYHALLGRALSDSRSLALKIGIDPADKPEVAVKKTIEFGRKLTARNKLWTLKPAVAKKHLKDNPPKKLMKFFSLRSIESAVKREPLSLLNIFAKKTEPLKWLDKYVAQAAKLNPADFDYQNVEISQVSSLRQTQLKKAGLILSQIVYVNYDVAGIVIVTPKKRFEGDVLFLIHSILQNIKILKSASLYLKIHSLEPGFSEKLEFLRKQGFTSLAKNYKSFGWNAHFKHLSSLDGLEDDGLDIMLEDDFKSLNITQILDDETVWQHHFLITAGENFLVSCNLSDVILNAVNKYEPGAAHYYFGQRELRDELFGRYLTIPTVQEFIGREFNHG